MRKTILLLVLVACSIGATPTPASAASALFCTATPEINIPYVRFTIPRTVFASTAISCSQYMNVRYEICLQEQSPFTFAWKTVRCRGTGTNGVFAYRYMKNLYVPNAVNCASSTVRKWRVYGHGDVYYNGRLYPFVHNGAIHHYFPHSGGKSLPCLV